LSNKIAQIALDSTAKESVCAVTRGAMDRTATEMTIKVYLREIRLRLDRAAGIAKAAEVCADSDQVDKAVELSLDIEQLAYEASRLLDAASLLNRLSQE